MTFVFRHTIVRAYDRTVTYLGLKEEKSGFDIKTLGKNMRKKGDWQIIFSILTLSFIGASKNSPFSGHQGKFLTGPTVSLKLTPDEVNSLRIPKVFIPHLDGIKECHFLVYHAIQSTMCLLIPAEVDFTVDFFRYVITTSVFIYTIRTKHCTPFENAKRWLGKIHSNDV